MATQKIDTAAAIKFLQVLADTEGGRVSLRPDSLGRTIMLQEFPGVDIATVVVSGVASKAFISADGLSVMTHAKAAELKAKADTNGAAAKAQRLAFRASVVRASVKAKTAPAAKAEPAAKA
jgi:hypothetical protein